MTRITLILLTFLTALTAPLTASAKLRVVATLADYGAIAREIGGDRVAVDVLAPHTMDPHYVDPRPNLILLLNKSDVLITNGLELEDAWLTPLVSQARNAKINVGAPGRFTASDHVKLIDAPTGAIDRAAGDVHPGGNPHFYVDPTSMIGVSNALRDHFSKLDPAGKATYEANAKTFTQALWQFAQAQALRFARLPAAQRQVVTYHKSLGYLLRWLQLQEAATIEPKPGVPPNPKHVASVLTTMKSQQVSVIVQETYYPRKSSDTLARLAEAQVVVLPAMTNFASGESYLAHMTQVTEALYAALSK